VHYTYGMSILPHAHRHCPNPPDVALCLISVACTSSQWRCRTGDCISYSQRCDGDRECSDGSDELNCSKHCAPV